MVPNEPKLSIVIPVLGMVDDLERTLISVLACRDPDSEVLVVLNRPYDDPYDLQDEVRFVHVPPDSGWVGSVNLAIDECRAPLVHLLACGATVDEGWTAAALAHFDDPNLGSVIPLVVEAEATEIVRSAGVAYEAGGRRRVVARGEYIDRLANLPNRTIGPTFVAGFYRRELLLESHGFSHRVGDLLADVDLALRLERAGYTTALEPASCVQFTGNPANVAGAWSSGRHAERLFRRHATQNGWLQSLTRHAFVIAGELWPRLPLRMSVFRLLGRASTWLTTEPGAMEIATGPSSQDETVTLSLNRANQADHRPDSHSQQRRSA